MKPKHSEVRREQAAEKIFINQDRKEDPATRDEGSEGARRRRKFDEEYEIYFNVAEKVKDGTNLVLFVLQSWG